MSNLPMEPPHGRLTIFLGYAAGVGKTYQMLEEGQALATKGVDVVIGYFEPHARKDTIAKTEGLESVPRKTVTYRGAVFQEMDTDAILARKPQVCLVDEFPHTNVPGSPRAKRWEDVLVLLQANIHVLTTMNIQHLESLNDQVYAFTNVKVQETIPDWVVKQADEVVMIDLTPRALLNRMQRGVVYAPDKALQAMQNFFKEPTLAALRELAIRQTAHELETRQSKEPGLVAEMPNAGAAGTVPVAAPQSTEKILIHITEAPSTAALIRRGRRVADYLQAACFAVYVHPQADLLLLPSAQREAIERHLNFARNLHIETRVLGGNDAAGALVDFARRNGVTQILVGRPAKIRRPAWLARQLLALQIVRLAPDMQVTVVAERRAS